MASDSAPSEQACHCGEPVIVHYLPEPFTRWLCQHCDEVRCDAYPGECKTEPTDA